MYLVSFTGIVPSDKLKKLSFWGYRSKHEQPVKLSKIQTYTILHLSNLLNANKLLINQYQLFFTTRE